MNEGRSLGVMEYRSVALGLQAADAMVKASTIKIIMMQTVCPGKYIIMFEGKLSSVQMAMEVGKREPFDTVLVDSYCLGNPDDNLFAAIYGTVEKGEIEALGILEGYSVASIVGAADEMVKTSPVKLIEVRLARGMTGKSYALFAGEVAAVEASLEKAKTMLIESGMYLHSAVIARPHPQIWEMLD
ncbi:MAG: BMC domain-containing protein [Cellulosilyticaceae bacterium]